MIAGDHDQADAGLDAARNRRRDLRARRILETNQPGEHHPGFRGSGFSRTFASIPHLPVRERQHAQPLPGHRVLRGQQARAPGLVQRDHALRGLHTVADREHALQRTLAVQHPSARRLQQHRHAFAVGIERNLVQPPVRVEAARETPSAGNERHFHRVADQLDALRAGSLLEVVAERRVTEQLLPEALQLRPFGQFVRAALLACQEQAPHRHAVLCQRAGLVAADHGSGAERLHRGQVAHQGVAPRHALRCHRERERHGGRESLGHVRHDDADREQEVLPERQPQRLTDDEERDAHAAGEHRHDARQARDLALQRRAGVAGDLRQVRDAPELGVHAGGVDHGASLPRCHRGTGQHDVAREQQRLLAVRFRRTGLGQRFTRDGRGIHAQPECLDHAAVSRHAVALFQQHHVARHQLGRGQLHDGAGAQRLHPQRQQPAQRRHGALGLVLLPEREQAVDQDDAEDSHAKTAHALAGLEPVGRERQRRRQPEDDREEVREFARQAQPQPLAGHVLEAVRAELGEPARGLWRRQAVSVAVQAGESTVDSKFMDAHGAQFVGRHSCRRVLARMLMSP